MKDPKHPRDDLAEPSAATVDFLVFAGLGFRWGLRCDVVVRVTAAVVAFAHPPLAATEEFLLCPDSDEVPRALWLKTPRGERTLVTTQRPEMRRVERALLHALPAVCTAPRPLPVEPPARPDPPEPSDHPDHLEPLEALEHAAHGAYAGPELRITGLAARDSQVLFLVAEPVG
ncbi:MAG: hypothetical protein U1A78_26210 [Polyangia bacterium]